ncbi:MAG: hypothetical protein ACD_75C00246G0002 [uncultured bacterium]|nr:MAG: hypothetical protein ACD_75C00246G0002 [uncultured bacterium]
MIDETHPVAAFRLVEVGGGDEDRHPFRSQPVEDAPEIPAAHRVDAVGRLIEEKHLRGMDEGADQLEFLFHAAREFAGLAVDERPHVAEVEQFTDALPPAFAAHAVEIGVEVDVLANRQVLVKPESLAHVGEVVLDRCCLCLRIEAGDPGDTGIRVHDRRQHPQRS